MTPLPVTLALTECHVTFDTVLLKAHVHHVTWIWHVHVYSGSPSAPGNLQLVPADPTLMLEWVRPANVPIEVPVTYLVEINSTDGNGMNFRNVTSSTSLSVHFLEVLLAAGQCIMYEFFVSGSNEAGSGDLAVIVDTVPICELVHVHTLRIPLSIVMTLVCFGTQP